jgi:hypothetical protein
MQQDCNPFSQGWPACLNNKTQSQVHSSLASAIIAGAMTVLQQQAFKQELIDSPDTDQTAKQYIGSMPTLGE